MTPKYLRWLRLFNQTQVQTNPDYYDDACGDGQGRYFKEETASWPKYGSGYGRGFAFHNPDPDLT